MPMKITNDYSAKEEIELELGPRVFRYLSAENGPGMIYVQAISDLGLLKDDSGEDWSDLLAVMHDDTQSDFTLAESMRMLFPIFDAMEGTEEQKVAQFRAWESRGSYDEDYDEAYEEMVRAESFEDWISEGGMDDTFPEEDEPYRM